MAHTGNRPDGIQTGREPGGFLLSEVQRPGGGSVNLRRLRVTDLPAVRHAARGHRGTGLGLNGARTAGWLALGALVILNAACAAHAPEQATSGYAYVGPATLNLRKDLGPRATTIATVKHGDRLEVLETRRRFVKVRVSGTVEGWTDGNLLLTQQQMDDLTGLAASAATLPSQGTGAVYEPLNMHTQPNRQSPTFYQIAEGASLDVVSHRVTLHGAAPPAPKTVVVRRVAQAKKSKTQDTKPDSVPPRPPRPRLHRIGRPYRIRARPIFRALRRGLQARVRRPVRAGRAQAATIGIWCAPRMAVRVGFWRAWSRCRSPMRSDNTPRAIA